MNLIYYLGSFLFGLIVGSFLNAWMWRVRENLSVINARSICPQCRQRIAFYDDVPLLSFILLKGKCRFCHGKISWYYPIVELSMGILYLAAFLLQHGQNVCTPEVIRDWIIIFFLAFIFLYDLKYREILDFTTLPLSFFLFVFSISIGWHEWWNMLIGAGIGAGFFLIQLIISRGKWIGGGDIRLGLLMGVILGWPYIVVALMLAYILGALISLILLALKKKRLTSEMPFGTYLTVATFIVMFWGKVMVDWYLGLLR